MLPVPLSFIINGISRALLYEKRVLLSQPATNNGA